MIYTMKKYLVVATETYGQIKFDIPYGSKITHVVFEYQIPISSSEYVRHGVRERSGTSEGDPTTAGTLLWDYIAAVVLTSGAFVSDCRYEYSMHDIPVTTKNGLYAWIKQSANDPNKVAITIRYKK